MLLVRNRAAKFIWGFTVVFIAGVAAMSWVFLRDGIPPGTSPPVAAAVAGVFWLGSAGLAAFALSRACTSVTLAPGGELVLRARYPFRVKEERIAVADLPAPRIVQESDGDGDPYFIVRVSMRDGTDFDLFESHGREECEQVLRRFERLRGTAGEGGGVARCRV